MSTVLVVEDSRTDSEVLIRCIKQLGLTAIGVTNGEEALAKLRSQKPDLVILDVILPGQSGFELCHTLKNSDDTKQIPVIICSSKGTDVDKLWGTMLGADAYLAKPVDPQQLIQVIQKLIV